MTDGWGSDVPDWPLDEEPPFDPSYDAPPPEHDDPRALSATERRDRSGTPQRAPAPRPDIPREVAQTLDPQAALAAAARGAAQRLGVRHLPR